MFSFYFHTILFKMFPLESKLLKVFQLSANFREAVRLTTETIRSISPDEILVKNMYVGVNATDLNVTAGRYFAHDPIPYRLGIEVCPTKKNTTNHIYGNYFTKCFNFLLSNSL